jgi:channel protein (hemolysin III family)
VLLRLDHAAIFVLIAGSFTPVHAILLRERWHWHLARVHLERRRSSVSR